MTTRVRNHNSMYGLILSAAMAATSPLPAFAEEPHPFQVETIDATRAIHDFGTQSGVQILASAKQLKGKKLNEVTGTLSTDAGLRALLAGTGLTHRYVGERTVALVRTDAKATSADEARGEGKERGFWSRFRLAQAGGSAPSLSSEKETAAASSAADSQKQIGLEEVIVTAQKREQRLIDVPQAVSVLSTDDLVKRGIVQFRDYAHTVPGLTFQTHGAGEAIVSIRGVTLGVDVSPTVGIYVDEVPYGSSSSLTFGPVIAFDAAPFDMERIEVLKGPQGTLYGASAMGGLIKYVSKRPNSTRFGVDAQAGVSSTRHGGVSEHGALTVNAPIVTDKLAMRATGFYSRDGGYIDNVARGAKDVNGSNIYGGRADLLFTPTDALSVRLTGSFQNIDRDGRGTADYTLAGGTPYGTLAHGRPTAEPFEQRFRLISGTVIYDLDWAALTSITSYQTARTQWSADWTAVFGPIAQRLFGGSYSGVSLLNSGPTDKFVQEVRLASEGSRSVDWVIGGFHTRETTGLNQDLLLFDLAGNLAPDSLLSLSVPSRFEESAAFGTLTWHLTDKLDVSGGIRYAQGREKATQHGSGALSQSAPTNRSSDSVATYLANALYRFSDQATLYFRYATGYRPGGPNHLMLSSTTGLPVGPPRFESDRLSNYEIGFKGETEDRRFAIDLAAFHIDWDDMILFAVRDAVGFRDNASGGARVRGAELTFTARPTNALTVTAPLAYMDARMREADADLAAAKGERLPGIPEFSASLSADYELPVGSLQPTLGATLRYVDDRNASFDGSTSNRQYRIPDYAAVDLRAGITWGVVDAQLYVRNLLDERGQLSAYYVAGLPRLAILQPRTIGISLSTSF